jgi:hypothetical protein
MIIAKLEKGFKLCVFNVTTDGSEKESYTLLKLSIKELNKLLTSAYNEGEGVSDLDADGLLITYRGDGKTFALWKELVASHKQNPDFVAANLSKEFLSAIPGTSCLIREPKAHVIKIALRKGNNTNTINRLCVSNLIRERFFADAKASDFYKNTGKYAIDTKDLNTYSYWSQYMNTCYLGNELKQN